MGRALFDGFTPGNLLFPSFSREEKQTTAGNAHDRKPRRTPCGLAAAEIFSLQGRLQSVEPARVVVEDFAGDGCGDFVFFAALLDDVQAWISADWSAWL